MTISLYKDNAADLLLIRVTYININMRCYGEIFMNHDVDVICPLSLCMDKNKETETLFNVFVNIRNYLCRH